MLSLEHIINNIRKSRIGKFLEKNAVHKIIILTIFSIVIFMSMVSSLVPKKYELKVGQKAPVDLVAPREMINEIETQRRIQKAKQAVEPREKIDPTIQIDIKKRIEKFFIAAYEIRAQEDVTLIEKINELKNKNTLELSDSDLTLILTAPEDGLKNIESYMYEIIFQVMSTGIKSEQLEKEKSEIENYFKGLKDFSKDIRSLGIKIVNSSLQPNRFLDVQITNQKIEEAENSVEDVMVKKGSLIVKKDEIISSDQFELLKAAGITNQSDKMDYSLLFGIIISILIMIIFFIVYSYAVYPSIFKKVSKLYLVFIIFLTIYIISKITYTISGYIAPVSAAAMLVGILLDTPLALGVNIILVCLLTLTGGNSLSFFITYLIAGSVAALSVAKTNQRANIFIAGLKVSLANVLIIVCIGLLNHYEGMKILWDSVYGMISGLFCAIFTIGSLPFWEGTFHILTPLKLLELSNPNQPVLKKLLLEAPGTYHHSIIVGNLSEAAAEAIGANGLFARTSAYYHDIGKLKRPYLFKENQLTHDNPHDKITPTLSAKIITSHVRDGIQLGKAYKLPKEIIDVIEQHHGDTLVKFFYHKALQEKGIENIDEKDFRYGKTKPQTRESAIVMLADSVEAAVRSMKEPNKEKIQQLIEKIIKGKLEDGQLEECPITLKNLKVITKSFQTVLMGIFHERIEYPEIKNEKTKEKE